jgi:hypothetical protein
MKELRRHFLTKLRVSCKYCIVQYLHREKSTLILQILFAVSPSGTIGNRRVSYRVSKRGGGLTVYNPQYSPYT